MPATKPEFNPAVDTLITTLFLHQDEEGNMIDIDTHLYHSQKHGFYLQEKRSQIWIERCWENVTEEDHRYAPANAPRRILTCVCRPVTPSEVIRLMVENHVPEEEGARDLALRALDIAGLPS
jgi:hypothetical protein